MQEYGEHQDKIRELEAEKAKAIAECDEARAELDKAAKKKAKLTEIDSVETGKTAFGGKVTVSQEDWDNVTALAKKQVASQKQAKKLRQERDDAVQERDKLKTKFEAVSSELAGYKKKEEEARCFSRKKLNAESQRITKEEQLKRNLQKVMAVIDAHGLSDEYNNTKLNTVQRKTVLG